MYILHSSRAAAFRQPYGAVPVGTTVHIALRIDPDGARIRQVSLAYAYGLYSFVTSSCRLIQQQGLLDGGIDRQAASQGEEPATGPDTQYFAASLRMPHETGLFFYWFEVETEKERVIYTRDRDAVDGSGVPGQVRPRWMPGEPHSPTAWQVTLYDPAFQIPDWLCGKVIYQIFPDRFCRDRGFTPERFRRNSRPERIFHEQWNEDVDYLGRPETGYLACDFFGGSLNGIREKLEYLADLGVSALYINPIFEARSNHRYDTGDYEQIDPLLGSEADFVALCCEAGQYGIRLILDGVFSHTGADSRYFNKYGRYPGIGAWQEAAGLGQSPYSSWYVFHRQKDQIFYDSWWGFPELPSVNEHDLSYRATMTGPDGIVRRWLRLGASGWRLDVSDELPDSFLRELRQAARAEKPDAVLLGEVWEDASNKISYGGYRDFLFGNTHDHVMGYPFQQALIGWLAGHFPARHMVHQLETLREHYPPAAWAASFNMISSHDSIRAITALAGPADPGSRDIQAGMQLTAEQRIHGEALLCLAALFQMNYPGCPVIYYGDETGMEGYRDPFNRRPFPWTRLNGELHAWFARLGKLRRDWPVLQLGSDQLTALHDDCILLVRQSDDPSIDTGPARVVLALNRSREARSVVIDGRPVWLPPLGWFYEADGQVILTAGQDDAPP